MYCIKQDSIDNTLKVWNNHLIRPSKNPNVPSGRPSVMFMVPSLYRTQDFKKTVDEGDIPTCRQECRPRTSYPCERDVYDFCLLIMREQQIDYPSSPQEGIHLFLQLREHINGALRE